MTFAFTAAGTKDQVLEQVDAAVAQHARYNNPPAELETIAAVIKHYLEVGAFPGGALIEANGHLGEYSGALQLTIKPLNIPQPPVPAVEPVAEPAAEPAPEAAPEPATAAG